MTNNALSTALLPVYKAAVEAANELGKRIKAASAGADTRLTDVLTNSTDPDIVKWREFDAKGREQIAAAEARLAEAKATILPKAKSLVDTVDDFDVEAAKKEFASKRADVTAIRKTILSVEGGDEKTVEAMFTEAGIEEITSLRGASGGGASTTGKPKPRLLSATVDGVALDKPTFTMLSSKTGVELDTLKAAAFSAAGTEDLSTKANEEISFSVNSVEKSGTVRTFQIVVVPKPKPSTVAAEKNEDEKSSDEVQPVA